MSSPAGSRCRATRRHATETLICALRGLDLQQDLPCGDREWHVVDPRVGLADRSPLCAVELGVTDRLRELLGPVKCLPEAGLLRVSEGFEHVGPRLQQNRSTSHPQTSVHH